VEQVAVQVLALVEVVGIPLILLQMLVLQELVTAQAEEAVR